MINLAYTVWTLEVDLLIDIEFLDRVPYVPTVLIQLFLHYGFWEWQSEFECEDILHLILGEGIQVNAIVSVITLVIARFKVKLHVSVVFGEKLYRAKPDILLFFNSLLFNFVDIA